MNGLISVIIPVYNASQTIERCVGSILNQTYRELEIILVDDASTDCSRDVLMRLEQMDPDRIMVICNDENRGPGGARNIGLSYAGGAYISFVDADDYVQSSFYEKMLSELQRGGYDFVDCGYYNEEKDKAMLHTGRDTRGILDDKQRCDLIVSGGYLWSRLYDRRFWDKCGIVFRENCILEDSEVITKLIASTESAGAVEETLYWYTASLDSASKERNAESYIRNLYDAMMALSGLSGEIENYEELRPAIEYEIFQMYDYGVVMALKDAQTHKNVDTEAELTRLKDLRLRIARPGYDNPYVIEKIEKEDIEVMRANDADPVKLIDRVLQQSVKTRPYDRISPEIKRRESEERILSIALIAKNESRYLREWIEYHRMMGASYFYVYDHGSTDDSFEIYDEYIKQGILEVMRVSGDYLPTQISSYNDALNKAKNNTRYLAFIDADEFLVPMKHDNAVDAIESILGAYAATPFKAVGSCEAGGIGVNWRVYGTSGHETPVEGLVIDEFKYRGPDCLMINSHIKTICRPECVKQIINPHFAIYEPGYWCISEHGSLIPAAFFYDSIGDILRLNHYYTKSEQEYRARRLNFKRSEAGRQRLQTEEEVTHTNELYDDVMERFVPALRERLNG